jgi:hypothetical protein
MACRGTALLYFTFAVYKNKELLLQQQQLLLPLLHVKSVTINIKIGNGEAKTRSESLNYYLDEICRLNG